MGRGKDLKKRKTRSDKKHRYHRNRAGNLVPYVSKRRDKNAPVRIWLFEMRPMSYDGYRNWTPKLRLTLSRTVFYPIGKPIHVDPAFVSTPERLAGFVCNVVGYPCVVQVRMCCHSKNSFRVSYKKRAIVKIVEYEEGLRGVASEYSKMSHYWFWRRR
jgi:hypothetical protein